MAVTTSPPLQLDAVAADPPAASKPPVRRRILVGALSMLIVGGIFGFALPQIASYRQVWGSLATMTWLGALLVALTATLNMFAAWIGITAIMPSIRLRKAAAVNLGSTAVANTLPGGGAVALGMSWAMLSSWGIGTAEYVRYTLVSGFWNIFGKLGLPVAAIVALVISGRSTGAWQVVAYSGAAVLLVVAVGLRVMLRSEPFALLVAQTLHRAVAAPCRLIRRRPPHRLPRLVLDFRAGASGLLAERGLRITLTTVAAQVCHWLVLLACLRSSGLSQAQVPWQVSLAAYAFVRVISLFPVTPGGLGVVEVGLTGQMAAGLGGAGAAHVAAAVLLFRAVTYVLPIPLGVAAYVWWRRTHPRCDVARRLPG